MAVAQPLSPRRQAWVHAAIETDLRVAMKIASMGGIDTCDKSGNVPTTVWSPQMIPSQAMGKLVQAKTIETLMWEQLRQQMTDNQHLVQQLEDTSVVPTWLIGQAAVWEEEYRKNTIQNHDIAQGILTVMYDTMTLLRPHLEDYLYPEADINAKFADHCQRHEQDIQIVPKEDLLMRFMFRHSACTQTLCNLAGAMLKKIQVCDTPGAYATRGTRHDMTTLVDDRLHTIVSDIRNTASWWAMFCKDIDTVMEDKDNAKWVDGSGLHQLVIDHVKMKTTEAKK